MMQKGILILIMCAICACATDLSNSAAKSSTKFFEIEKYFQQEALRLQKEVKVIQKTTAVGEQTEARDIQKPNFEQELALFRESNINRPAWYDKYSADTIQQAAQTIYRYKALDNALKTKTIEIYLDSAQIVQKISIINISKNAFSDIEQFLTYYPNSGYEVNSIQDLAFFPASKIGVKVRF